MPRSNVPPVCPKPSMRPRTDTRYSSGKKRYSSATSAPDCSPRNVSVAPSGPTVICLALGVRRHDPSAVVSLPAVRENTSIGLSGGTSCTGCSESTGVKDL